MVRHLWAPSTTAEILWFKWVHTYVIKTKNLWHMTIPQDSSWTIRKLLKIIDLGQPLMRYVVRDGIRWGGLFYGLITSTLLDPFRASPTYTLNLHFRVSNHSNPSFKYLLYLRGWVFILQISRMRKNLEDHPLF